MRWWGRSAPPCLSPTASCPPTCARSWKSRASTWRRYAQAANALAALPAGATLLLDPRRVTYGTRQAVAGGVRVIEAINPTTLAKSRKSDSEAAHVRAAMEQDGAALCEFFSWLDATLADPQRAPLTEIGVDEHLTACRARRAGFVSPSFGTIAGFNAHGAIMHYHAQARQRSDHRRRRPAADRLGRPVPGRHHRYHARGAGGRHHGANTSAISRWCCAA